MLLLREDRDIIYKCIEIAIKETNDSMWKLLYESIEFILSFDRLFNEQNGYGDDTGIETLSCICCSFLPLTTVISMV